MIIGHPWLGCVLAGHFTTGLTFRISFVYLGAFLIYTTDFTRPVLFFSILLPFLLARVPGRTCFGSSIDSNAFVCTSNFCG